MSRLIAPLLALAMGASPALAGAWLRAEGGGFLSSTINVQDDDDTTTYGTLYAEYGINPDLTVGLDIGSDEGGDHKGLAFVLMPLSRDGLHVAFELAAGTLDEGAALRPGISVGRSLSIKDLNGWWSVDTRARLTTDDISLAIDTTVGLKLPSETMLIGQLQHGGPIADPDFLRLSGSVVWPISAGRHIEVGLTTGLMSAEDFGVRLGMWRSF